jgi:hypothetical protein
VKLSTSVYNTVMSQNLDSELTDGKLYETDPYKRLPLVEEKDGGEENHGTKYLKSLLGSPTKFPLNSPQKSPRTPTRRSSRSKEVFNPLLASQC